MISVALMQLLWLSDIDDLHRKICISRQRTQCYLRVAHYASVVSNLPLISMARAVQDLNHASLCLFSPLRSLPPPPPRPPTPQVHFIIASCENMVAGKGLRPGDVLKAASGKTVEVNK
jgi:hypothetical protein